MSRCKHETAKPARFLQDWLWCGECRSYLRERDVKGAR